MRFASWGGAYSVAAIAFAALIFTSARADRLDDELALSDAKGFATREGNRLVLTLASGKTVAYEDPPVCRDPLPNALCYGHRLEGYERQWNLFRVAIDLWEGRDHLLIDDRTGEETAFDGDLQFSASGNHVVEMLAGVDGYDSKGPAVQVWRRRGHKFVVEWSGAPDVGEETYYSVLAWLTPGRIDLRSMTRGQWDREAEQMTPDILRYYVLKRRAKGWQLFKG